MNNIYKIIALFGPAGAGKDYIQKAIMKTIWGRTHFHEIVSYTTRPPREGEVEGIHYHFVKTPEELVKRDILEYTSFRNWWYGTAVDNLNPDKINIGVFNIAGITQLLNKNYQKYDIDCLPIYIKSYDKIRLMRQLNREQSPDCEEICRRFIADKKDFEKIPFHYCIIENNTNEIQPIVSEIIGLSKSMDKINLNK